MHAPEREVPGISATACHSPRMAASRSDQLRMPRVCGLWRSNTQITTPKRIIIQPITATERIAAIASVRCSTSPSAITGTVAIARHSASHDPWVSI